MTLIRVEEDSSFARDEYSGCIINVNDREYNLAKQRSDVISQLMTMIEKVNSLEHQMNLILDKLNENNNAINNN